jgi:hypothetical protein
MEKIEYRVRPVTRFIVTRFHSVSDDRGDSAGCEGKGEFDNADTAYAVAYALCKEEHERLGYPVADERIQYPQHPNDPNVLMATTPPRVYEMQSVSTV